MSSNVICTLHALFLAASLWRSVSLSGSSCVRVQLALTPQHQATADEPVSYSVFETIALNFRTAEQGGVLFNLGTKIDFVSLILRGGHLWLLSNISDHLVNDLLTSSLNGKLATFHEVKVGVYRIFYVLFRNVERLAMAPRGV